MSAAGSGQGIRLLRSAVRRRLVDHLDGLPRGPEGEGPTRDRGLTAAELAEVVGLHITTVRFHVDRLVEAGLLTASDDLPSGAGRPPKRYAVTWAATAAAGVGPARTPGSWLGRVGTVLDLLIGWGHDPDLRTRAGAREVDIVLHDCPFLDLAQDTPQVVCGVHRSLLRGALDELGEGSVEVDLHPLVTDRTCVAQLTVPDPFADRGDPS